MIIYFILLAFCVIFPKEATICTTEAISLWAKSVLPTLLPFFIISKIILFNNGIYYFSKAFMPIAKVLKMPLFLAFPFSMSLLCGFPTGSRILSEMEISDKDTLQKSAEICYSSSPIFIIGTVGTSMLKSIQSGVALYVIHICSLLLFTSFIKFKHNFEFKETSFNGTVASAVSESVLAILNICGFMVLFAIINKIISYILPNIPYVKGMISGITEFTSGISALSSLSSSLPAISFLLSFGGMCVIVQCKGFLKQIDIMHFIFTRTIIGLISCILCIIYEKTALYVPIIITICIITVNNLRRK